MPDSPAHLKIFTLEEANATLPQVRTALAALRHHVTQVLAQEASVDASELVAGQSATDPRVVQALALLQECNTQAQQAFEALERLGCHLKDLDAGLVDFYTWMDGELVLLCWRDGEDQVRYWHPVNDGFAGRQPIPGT